jgi:hypothetical protein
MSYVKIQYISAYRRFNQNKIKKTVSKENFEEWDDFILWESYFKALQYWSKMA